MKYTIEGLNQPRLVELGLDGNDAIILRWFTDFWQGRMEKRVFDGQEYGWAAFSHVAEDLPILGIEPQAVARRFKRYRNRGVLFAKVARDDNSKTYFRANPEVWESLTSEDSRRLERREAGAFEGSGPAPLKATNPSTTDPSTSDPVAPAGVGTLSLFTAPEAGEPDLAGEKKAKKEKHRRIRGISDRFYALYGEARGGAKPRWGVKEQTLVWQDLDRIGDARLMALIESWFKDDLPESVEDWQKKAGLEYVAFHSQIDKLLDLVPVEEKQPQARECVNCHAVTVPVQGVCRKCGHTWNVDWQAERAAAKRERHAVGA